VGESGLAGPVSGPSEGGPPAGSLIVAEPVGGGWREVAPVAAAGSLRGELVELAIASGVDPTYPPEVLSEAAVRVADPGLDDPSLVDLRHLPWVTIDPARSRDLDQALVIEPDGAGFLVRYAIADAAWYVQPGSALFEEALRRGASYYLPGFAVPMLPAALSEGVVSINPQVDRRALVFEVRLDPSGGVQTTRITRALVRSRRKLSYVRVQRGWDEPAGSGFHGQEYAPSLDLLREVGRLRLAEAARRHAVSFHRHETEVRLADGERTGFRILSRDRLEVERCSEQLSLLVNVEGARLLADAVGDDVVQPIFRVHPSPSLERLARFEAQVDALVRLHGLDPGAWRWRRDEGESLADYLERLPTSLHRRAVVAGIERQALLTNERSVYDPEPGPHFGVAAPVYARFSSPMREIVGVFTHKEALEALGLEAARSTLRDLELRDLVVAAGNRSRDLQRRLASEAERLVLDRLFSPELGRPVERRTRLPGTVLGVAGRRAYVRLDDPPVEVQVDAGPIEAALGARVDADPLDVALVDAAGRPRVVIGDRLTLRVVGHDLDRRLWLFEPTGDGSWERTTRSGG
jgi:ribonuclease R